MVQKKIYNYGIFRRRSHYSDGLEEEGLINGLQEDLSDGLEEEGLKLLILVKNKLIHYFNGTILQKGENKHFLFPTFLNKTKQFKTHSHDFPAIFQKVVAMVQKKKVLQIVQKKVAAIVQNKKVAAIVQNKKVVAMVQKKVVSMVQKQVRRLHRWYRRRQYFFMIFFISYFCMCFVIK